MCKHGITATQVKLAKPRSDGRTHAPIDPCIAPIVQALNDGGILTIASCCGHGHRPGSIIFQDEKGEHQEMMVMPHAEARKLYKLWPDIHGERLPEENQRQ